MERERRTIFYSQRVEAVERAGLEVEISVDRADPRWKGIVGFVTTLIAPSPAAS